MPLTAIYLSNWYMTSRHNDLTSGNNFLTSRHNDLTSQHKIWQVDINIWQVNIIIWQVMAEICHHSIADEQSATFDSEFWLLFSLYLLQIFCGRCSSNFVPLPHFGYINPVRVCNHCFLFQVTPFTVNEWKVTLQTTVEHYQISVNWLDVVLNRWCVLDFILSSAVEIWYRLVCNLFLSKVA